MAKLYLPTGWLPAFLSREGLSRVSVKYWVSPSRAIEGGLSWSRSTYGPAGLSLLPGDREYFEKMRYVSSISMGFSRKAPSPLYARDTEIVSIIYWIMTDLEETDSTYYSISHLPIDDVKSRLLFEGKNRRVDDIARDLDLAIKDPGALPVCSRPISPALDYLTAPEPKKKRGRGRPKKGE